MSHSIHISNIQIDTLMSHSIPILNIQINTKSFD